METRHINTQLAVVGSGIAGFSASIFAANRNISTAQAGNTGAVAYTTGYLDLFGQLRSGQKITNPWQGLRDLQKEHPNHPLGQINHEHIKQAFTEFTAFLNDSGITYSLPSEKNLIALTPAGTLKPTYSVPATMESGPAALAARTPCTIVDFKGLKGFSGKQVVANLRDKWPELTTERITFPGMDIGEIYPEVMARALEVAATRQRLADKLTKAAGRRKTIGIPAVLGMHTPDIVKKELEKLTGLTIFEIPTMPPAVPGIRIREMFEQVLPQKGITLIPQQKVDSISLSGESVKLKLKDNYGNIAIEAETVLVATGRFLSGGLTAEMNAVREPLLHIPVAQPENRTQWYGETYISGTSHPLHLAGIETDEKMRPLGADGKIISERLFAAGAILANQSWIRERCGAGIAIATAFQAVQAIDHYVNQ